MLNRTSDIDMSILDSALNESRKKLAHAQRQSIDTNGRRALEQRAQRAEANKDELEYVIGQLNTLLRECQTDKRNAEKAADRLREELESTKRQVAYLVSVVPSKDESRRRVKELEIDVAELCQELVRAKAATDQAKSCTESALSEAEARYNSDLSAAGDRRAELESALSEAELRLSTEIEESRSRLTRMEEKARVLENERDEAKAHAAKLEIELNVAQAKIEDLEGRLDDRVQGQRRRSRSNANARQITKVSSAKTLGRPKSRTPSISNTSRETKSSKYVAQGSAYGGIKPLQ